MVILAGTIRCVNSRKGTSNCVNCAIATDAVLDGRPASALPGGPYRISVLEQIFGAKFSLPVNPEKIVEALLSTGSGSRAIVFGVMGAAVGHVFNAVNQGGVIRFLDGQTGTVPALSMYAELRFLRTN